MKTWICRLFHFPHRLAFPRFDRFGTWDMSCSKCGRRWERIDP